jgi:hypothetical protein
MGKFKKEHYSGFSVETRKYDIPSGPSYDPLGPVIIREYKDNFGMLIPATTIKVSRGLKLFGWHVLFMKKWVGFKKWRRTVPVRDDLIINFMFWYFVKPMHDERPKFSHNRKG